MTALAPIFSPHMMAANMAAQSGSVDKSTAISVARTRFKATFCSQTARAVVMNPVYAVHALSSRSVKVVDIAMDPASVRAHNEDKAAITASCTADKAAT